MQVDLADLMNEVALLLSCLRLAKVVSQSLVSYTQP